MPHLRFGKTLIALCLAICFSSALAQPATTKKTTNPAAPVSIDLTQPTLFLVPYTHLDDVWRWSYPQVIRDFLKRTLDDNFAAFEKYPDYVFNWSGASRYQMIKEYYPEKYEELKKWIAAGRWYPSGSSWVENDVNVPSTESNIRQLLLGTKFFEQEFGKESREFMLPDCFGFPYSLPSVLNHCGIRGFSTQKLTWESANGIPFNVGRWTGPDGKWVIAALNAGDYARPHKNIYSTDKATLERLEKNRQQSGLPIDYYYMGGGDSNNADRGGVVQQVSLETLTKSLHTPGPVKVVAGKADAMFTAISNEQAAKFPVWNSDLQLIKHSTGVLSSQAYTKKINRDAELLADAGERAAVLAHLLTGSHYPAKVLNEAWGLVLRNQFHDNLPGTSIPKVYEHSWNDGIIALNQFSGVLKDAVGAIAKTLNTDVPGVPVVVYNPLSVSRTDIAEASIPEALANANTIAVFDAKGVEVPSQITTGFDGKRRILFQTNLPPVGAVVYSLREAKPNIKNSHLLVSNDQLENQFYRVKMDKNGDIASIYDKRLGKEILEKPIQLEFGPNFPDTKPAWRIYWKDIVKPARSVASNPLSVKVVENGPLRVAIELVRENEGSTIKQRIQLSAGADGNRVETLNQIDWKSRGTLLKAAFHFTASAPEATYNLGLGTIKRGNRTEKQYEVSHHSWIDLTDTSGDFGVSILSGAKYGSDKVDDNTLRLTLIHGPDTKESLQEVLDDGTMSEMRWQDWGRHEFSYALTSHKADWRQAKTHWEAMRFEQRPAVFEVPKYKAKISLLSFLNISNDQVNIQAVKMAEDGSGVVVRLQELNGQACRELKLAASFPIVAAEMLDGVERPLNTKPSVKKGILHLNFDPYELKTIKLKFPDTKQTTANTQPIALKYDTDIFSFNSYREDGYDDRNPRSEGHRGTMDGKGGTYPAEMIEDTVRLGNVTFAIGPRKEKTFNAVACLGQTMDLPVGTKVLHILAAADVDTEVKFSSGGKEFPLTIGAWTGYIGQWDNREFEGFVAELSYSMRNKLKTIHPAYIRNHRIAWAASHHHKPAGDALYEYSYLFAYRLEIPQNATSITLPDSRFVRIVAMSAGDEGHATALQSPFGDLYRDKAVEDDFTAYVDPTIGNVSQFLVPTYPTFQLPNQQLRMFPVKTDYIADQVTAWPLQVITHREAGILRMKVSLGSISNKSWSNKMTIDHNREIVHPWHYATYLVDDDITVSFSPAAKSAVYKFDFPEAQQKNILISGTEKMKASLISNNSFMIEEKYNYVKKGINPETVTMNVFCYAEITDIHGKPVEKMNFDTSKGRLSISLTGQSAQTVIIKYSISYISPEQAKINFSKEIAALNFEATIANAKKAWQKVINQIQVEGGSEAQKRSFYTALYRTYERMIDVNEYGQYYSGYDGKIHQSNRPFFVDDWIWDTFLAKHPLTSILDPGMQSDILNSYVTMYEQSGWMPTFPQVFGNHLCMNGYRSSALFIDAYRKGIAGFDINKAYEGVKKNLAEGTLIPWRQGNRRVDIDDFYHEQGFFPALRPGEPETEPLVDGFEKRQPVALSLGMSYDAWCLAELAKELNRKDDYLHFSKMAQNYRKLWHPEMRLFMPKDSKGEWIMINPKLDGGRGYREYYDENNGWTYAWQVQHDIDGLIELLGGKKATEERLDQLFREPLDIRRNDFYVNGSNSTGLVGQFSMGNEPSFHIPYLYNYAGAPWKAQSRIRFLLDVWFKDNIFGIPGDEDGGGMSAFVVFSSLGFYPVTPGLPVYSIVSPVFEKSTIQLPNNRTFTVVARGSSPQNKYIQKAYLNGREIKTPFFTHQQLMEGGKLELILSNTPHKTWGVE